MAVKTRYRIRQENGEYEVIHFETSADQILTTDDMQFITAEEKAKLQTIQKSYIHNQLSATETWEINHNLNRFPSVSIVDSAGSMVMGDITYINENLIIVNFSSAFSGKAYLN